ncbi:SdrD B-like domain-containing protein [Spirosoma migulaei]
MLISSVECTPLLGSIGDFVWNDQNKDGQQDSNEPGVDGVIVRLLQETTPGNYTVVSTTVTSGNGTYLFPSLPGGTYVVEFDKTTLPANFTLTTVNALGVTSSLDSDADPVTGRSGLIALVPTNPALRDRLTIDAGIVNTDCPPTVKCIPIAIKRIR